MRKQIKKTVYKILLEDEYARENDNYLIVRVAQELDPITAGSTFVSLVSSSLSLESVTRARRAFLKDNPRLKPKRITEIRKKEEQEYLTKDKFNSLALANNIVNEPTEKEFYVLLA